MSKIFNINGHDIAVPDDMTANVGDKGPGAYDCIEYKNAEICTLDVEYEGEYNGGFVVCFDNGHMSDILATLDECRAFIDNQ